MLKNIFYNQAYLKNKENDGALGTFTKIPEQMFFMFVLRPNLRSLLQSILDQTCHGCITHDIVVNPCSEQLMRLSYYPSNICKKFDHCGCHSSRPLLRATDEVILLSIKYTEKNLTMAGVEPWPSRSRIVPLSNQPWR